MTNRVSGFRGKPRGPNAGVGVTRSEAAYIKRKGLKGAAAEEAAAKFTRERLASQSKYTSWSAGRGNVSAPSESDKANQAKQQAAVREQYNKNQNTSDVKRSPSPPKNKIELKERLQVSDKPTAQEVKSTKNESQYVSGSLESNYGSPKKRAYKPPPQAARVVSGVSVLNPQGVKVEQKESRAFINTKGDHFVFTETKTIDPNEKQGPNPPPEYKPGEATVNVLKEYAATLIQPRNIVADIFDTDEQYKARVERERVGIKNIHTKLQISEDQRGPTLLSSSIEQAMTGQVPSGTGKGLAYDVESGAAEAALILLPTKGKIPGLSYQNVKVYTNEGKVSSVWKGLTFKNQPLLGSQDGKLVKGFNPSKVPYEKIQTGDLVAGERGGGEIAKGTGASREIFFGDKSLKYQRDQGIISEFSYQRALAARELTDEAYKTKGKTGGLGELPIKNLTQKQSDYTIEFAAKLQKEKKVDTIHGSASTRAHTGDVRDKAGSVLQMGDVDLNPKYKRRNILGILRGEQKLDVREQAFKYVEEYKQNFPLEKGQGLEIKGSIQGEKNIGLELTRPGKKPIKIFEMVFEKEKFSEYGLPKSDKILNKKLPKGYDKTPEGLKVTKENYQLLTNIKQVLSAQKAPRNTLSYYPDVGREKDIIRPYWLAKQKALTKNNEKLDIKAEEYRANYPELKFEGENVMKVTYTPPSSNLLKSFNAEVARLVPPSTLIKPKPKGEEWDVRERDYDINRSEILDRETEISREFKVGKSMGVDSNKTMEYAMDPLRFVLSGGRGSSSLKSIKEQSYKIPSIKTNLKPSYTPTSSKPSYKGPSIKSLIGGGGGGTGLPPSTKDTSKKGPSIKVPSIRVPSQRVPGRTVKVSSRMSTLTGQPSPRLQAEKIKRIPPLIIIQNTTKTPRPSPRERRIDFIGHTPLTQIEGFYKRKTVIYGDKKTDKLAKADRKLSKSKWSKTVKGLTGKNTKIKVGWK